MLNHTYASLDIVKKELSFFAFMANIISSVFMLGYLIFASIFGRGILGINIALASLTTVNLIVYLAFRKRKDKESKAFRKFVYHFYKISKILLNSIPLASILYLLAFTGEEISRIEMVFLPLVILLWLAQVVLEISTLYFQSRLTLLVDGVKMDFETVINPIVKAKNILKIARGEEVEEVELVSNRNRDIISQKASERAAEKEAQREARKSDVATAISKTKDIIREFVKK